MAWCRNLDDNMGNREVPAANTAATILVRRRLLGLALGCEFSTKGDENHEGTGDGLEGSWDTFILTYRYHEGDGDDTWRIGIWLSAENGTGYSRRVT